MLSELKHTPNGSQSIKVTKEIIPIYWTLFLVISLWAQRFSGSRTQSVGGWG